MENPYKVLGVEQDATVEQIMMAYRRKSAKFHPDRNPDNPEAARCQQEVNDAYAILSDPAKRAEWDETSGSSAKKNAIDMLQHEFDTLIELNREGDLIKALKEQCRSKRDRGTVARSHAKSQKKKLEARLLALRGPSNNDFLRAVLERKIHQHEFAISQIDEAFEALDIAEKLLLAYSWIDQDPGAGITGLLGSGRPGQVMWYQKD